MCEVQRRLQTHLRNFGSQAALARYLGVSDMYLSDVLAGKRAPGPKILKPLGLKKIVMVKYEPVSVFTE